MPGEVVNDARTLEDGPSPATVMTVEQAYTLFTNGVLGTKEFRSWLAKIDSTFASVRDADIDNEIDDLARRRRQRALEDDQQDESRV